MINIYDNLRDANDNVVSGRIRLFINSTDDDGVIELFATGSTIPETCGRMFIVDDWLIDQIDKLLLINDELVVKDGETLEPPIKSDLDLEEEELQRRLADIQRRRQEKENEPASEADNLPAVIPEHDEIINDDLRQSTDT